MFVRVGVTRPFDPTEAGNLQYWLQIDGLHFFSKITRKYVRDFHVDDNGVVGVNGAKHNG